MIYVDASLVPQVVPELGQLFRRHVHRTPAHVLVELVRSRRDVEPEEQQNANLAVQRSRIAEFGLQRLDFAKDLGFGAHALILRRNTLDI